MMTNFIFVCGALGVAGLALALSLLVTMALAVWLGGSDWARRRA